MTHMLKCTLENYVLLMLNLRKWRGKSSEKYWENLCLISMPF